MILSKIYCWLHKKFSRPDERGEYSAGVWQNAVREKILSFCGAKQGKILEVGCGEGLFLSKIAKNKKYSMVCGVDIWRDILIRAGVRFKADGIKSVELAQADAAMLPFKDDVFDTIVCMNVFFNLPGNEAFQRSMEEISRVCRQGGDIIFDIRNSRNPLLKIKYKFAKYYDETVKDLPLRTYSFEFAKLNLEKYGFEITDKIEIGFPYNGLAPIFVIRAKRR